MVIGYGRWDRRDGADRDRLGQAALAFCRALRSETGVQDARFYWSGVDSLVVLTDAVSAPGRFWAERSGADAIVAKEDLGPDAVEQIRSLLARRVPV